VGIWKAREFIEEHSGEELSLRRMAKAVNIHPNYLSARFKHITGMTFVEYVASTRFQRARGLLHNGDVASAKPRSLQAFNRFHSSIVFSRDCPANRPRNSVVPNVWIVCIDRTSISLQEKAEKMGSNYFLLLRILAVRVEFETNSMDPR